MRALLTSLILCWSLGLQAQFVMRPLSTADASFPLDGLIALYDLDEGSAVTAYNVWAPGIGDLGDTNSVDADTGTVDGARDYDDSANESHGADVEHLRFDDNDFSISCWVRLASEPATMFIFSLYETTGPERSYALVYTSASDDFVWRVSDDGDYDAANEATSTLNVTTATWYHVYVEFTNSTGVVLIRVNDSNQNSATQPVAGVHPGDCNFILGSYSSGGSPSSSGDFDGDLDQVAIFNRTLDAEEITRIYAAGAGRDAKQDFHIQQGMVSWWSLESDGTDSHFLNTVAAGDAPTYTSGKVGNAGDFELADTDFLILSDANQVGLDITGPISIAVWVNLESVGANGGILSKYAGGSQNEQSYMLWYQTGFGFTFTLDDTGSSPQSLIATTEGVASTSTWYHVVGVWDGKTMLIYVDGSEDNTSAYAEGIYSGAANVAIGCWYNNAAPTGHFDGLIDEVGIWNRALAPEEITALYAGGSPSAYSTTALTQLIAAWLLWEYDNTAAAANWANGGSGFDLTVNNTPDSSLISSGPTKLWRCRDFNGTSEYYSDTTPVGMPGGDIAFTFVCWINMDSDNTQDFWIANQWDTASADRVWVLRHDISDSQFDFLVDSDGTGTDQTLESTFSPAPAADTWYMLSCWHDPGNNEIGIGVNTTFDTAAYSSGLHTPGDNTFYLATDRLSATELDGELAGPLYWRTVVSTSILTDIYNSGVGAPFPLVHITEAE